MAESEPDKCLDKDTYMYVYTTLIGYSELISDKARSLYDMSYSDRERDLYEDLEVWAHSLAVRAFENLTSICRSAQSPSPTQQDCYPKWRDISPPLKNLQGALEELMKDLNKLSWWRRILWWRRLLRS